MKEKRKLKAKIEPLSNLLEVSDEGSDDLEQKVSDEESSNKNDKSDLQKILEVPFRITKNTVVSPSSNTVDLRSTAAKEAVSTAAKEVVQTMS